MPKRIKLTKKGFGVADSMFAMLAASSLAYVSARVLGTNIHQRALVEGSIQLKQLDDSLGPTVTEKLHDYLVTLRTTHQCQHSAFPMTQAIPQINLPRGESLTLFNPANFNSATPIGGDQAAFERCQKNQTWMQMTDFSSVDTIYFCMSLSKSSEISEALIEFTFKEKDVQSNASITCNSIGRGPANLQRLDLESTIHGLPAMAKSYLAASGVAQIPLAAVRGSRSNESNFGLFDIAGKEFYLDTDGNGVLDKQFQVTNLNDPGTYTALSGDWDGDAKKTFGVALYNSDTQTFYFKNTLETGDAESHIKYQAPQGWKPFAGAWSVSGAHGVGLYDPSKGTFHIDSQKSGEFDINFQIQDGRIDLTTAVPFTGDWTGSGQSGVALVDAGNKVCFKSALQSGPCDGLVQDLPCAGCVAMGGNVERKSAQDTLHAFNKATGTFYWLEQNGIKMVWDADLSLGPSPSPWAPLKGFWQGRSS